MVLAEGPQCGMWASGTHGVSTNSLCDRARLELQLTQLARGSSWKDEKVLSPVPSISSGPPAPGAETADRWAASVGGCAHAENGVTAQSSCPQSPWCQSLVCFLILRGKDSH